MMWQRGDAYPANWPEWLREADIDWCDVSIVGGGVLWHSGAWYSGVWRGGVWHGGEWHGGVWRGGVWCGGEWRGGEWHGGEWRGGVWHGGEWRGGVWHGGEWHGGVWRGGGSATRSRRIPLLLQDGRIQIGCKRKFREEWDEWFAGTEEYETPRGTEGFAMIEAHYRALCAYIDSMEAFHEEGIR